MVLRISPSKELRTNSEMASWKEGAIVTSYRDKYHGDMNVIRAGYDEASRKARIVDPRFNAIAGKESNVTSQFGEDGLIAAIFELIGVKHRRCFEVGASDGEFFSNTKTLRDQGWDAVLVEANEEDAARLAAFRTSRVQTTHGELTAERGIDFFFGTETGNSPRYDLGVIDTDGDDASFWAAAKDVRPRVLCIECAGDWGLKTDGQSPREALLKIAKEKNYSLVALTWCNALFVADEEIPQSMKEYKPVKIVAAMSRPREGPLDTMDCIVRCMTRHGIPYASYPGPFWEQGIQNAMESAIDKDVDILITFDYDSLFTENDFDVMLHTFLQHPEMDALAALQPQRGTGILMFGLAGTKDGSQVKVKVGDIIKVDYAHFGLTFFRLAKLKEIKKPWLLNVPCADGSWMRKKDEEFDKQRIDADMYFWREKWSKAGNNSFVHTGVFLGHIERMVAIFNIWKDADGKEQGGIKHFHLNDWLRSHPVMYEASKP